MTRPMARKAARAARKGREPSKHAGLPPVKLLVGLGNPGSSYAGTRHNVGFMLAEAFLSRHGRGKPRKEHGALVASARWAGEELLVAQPQGFMNLSGRSVKSLCRAYEVDAEDLVVAYDDADLPLGFIRIRPSGSPAGHRGLASIVGVLSSLAFPRMRLGIGRPGTAEEQLADYVLDRFTEPEQKVVKEMLARATDAMEMLLQKGVKMAMSNYNRRNLDIF